ncbi:MarR family transcriptional regulator [Rapidithrix thailandica]|uniref:MarR family transcriptional regulator n=1 Tax=Rapidithrix thailandica TaxID=413964 RepID=A0AAW9RZN7_9BACT
MKLEDEIQHTFTSSQIRVITNLVFTSNWALSKISQALKPIGLSLQQLNILRILKGQPHQTATVNLIKERMVDRMPNVSRLLNKLMEKGLIVKERNLTDQRVVYIKLTPEGEKLSEKGKEILETKCFDVRLSDEESDLLNTMLEKLRY